MIGTLSIDGVPILEVDMQFNVVMGNPPYNGGVYKDFMRMSEQMSSMNSFFVPAAFIADPKMDSFNNYIDDIVIYQKTHDIWKNVDVYSGVCYYVYDRLTGIKKEKTIVNIRKGIENTMRRSLCHTIQNDIYRLDTLWKNKNKYYFDVHPRKYNVAIEQFVSGGVLKNSIRLSPGILTDKFEKYKDVYKLVFSSDNIDEVIGFIYWMDTYIVNFYYGTRNNVMSMTQNALNDLECLPFDASFLKMKITDDFYFEYCDIDEQLKQYIIENTGKKRKDMIYRIDVDDENVVNYFQENTRR